MVDIAWGKNTGPQKRVKLVKELTYALRNRLKGTSDIKKAFVSKDFLK